MKVSLSELMSMFDNLIEQKKTREEIADWATERQKEADRNNIEYETIAHEKIILEGILYLMGCDLKDSPNSYLHSIENFVDKKKSLLQVS